MKLLIDENLSLKKLVLTLGELYPGSKHVFDVALSQSPDAAIWTYAKDNGFILVSADSDFFDLAANFGAPPKLIWLRRWDHPTRDAEKLLRREAVKDHEFRR